MTNINSKIKDCLLKSIDEDESKIETCLSDVSIFKLKFSSKSLINTLSGSKNLKSEKIKIINYTKNIFEKKFRIHKTKNNNSKMSRKHVLQIMELE